VTVVPSDPDLPARAWDFPAWQAARLVSGAAQEAARAWTRRLPAAVVLDVSWDLHTTFRDLGIALSRLSRFRPEPGPSEPSLHDPGSHIFRAGHAIGMASTVLRDRAVREHVRHTIAYGLPVGGDPRKGDPAITAAVDLAEAATAAFRIIGTSPSGDVLARDAAVGAFMRTVDNLDAAVHSLAEHAPGPDAARLEAARPGLEEAYIDLREALICSAVDFRQPGGGRQVLAMRGRYPVLPHRTRDTAASSPAWLASASFPPGSVLEAVIQPPSPTRARSGAPRARGNTAIHGETR
jgi:hypothetical protein